MPNEYQVIWKIDLSAESPGDAARKALAIQRNPASIATVFEVIAPQGRRFRIDLEPKNLPVTSLQEGKACQ